MTIKTGNIFECFVTAYHHAIKTTFRLRGAISMELTEKQYKDLIDNGDHRDELLVSFVEMLNEKHINSFGVTLFVHGIVISGLAVSRDEYWKTLFDTLAKAIKSERNFDKENIEDKEDDAIRYTKFIHLKNPNYLYPNHNEVFAETEHPYVRFKLADVNGWIIIGNSD
jgi:hypothetical protein